MATERLLNDYYNKGCFNDPNKIGYMMKMIRQVKPLTEEEWRDWYLTNVHDEDFLIELAEEMAQTIPDSEAVCEQECFDYICDVMFHRTFQGYNREHTALKVLRENVSPDVQESPSNWDNYYFIDFFLKDRDGLYIGIQLKPETFFEGHYERVVDIDRKMEAFRKRFGARTFVLIYRQTAGEGIEFLNDEVIDEIKSLTRC